MQRLLRIIMLFNVILCKNYILFMLIIYCDIKYVLYKLLVKASNMNTLKRYNRFFDVGKS